MFITPKNLLEFLEVIKENPVAEGWEYDQFFDYFSELLKEYSLDKETEIWPYVCTTMFALN